MATADARSHFRLSAVEQTTAVQAGYLVKPMAVSSLLHKESVFAHVSTTEDWVCRAVTGQGRGQSPLKGSAGFLQALTAVSFGGNSTALAAEEVDPMAELLHLSS